MGQCRHPGFQSGGVSELAQRYGSHSAGVVADHVVLCRFQAGPTDEQQASATLTRDGHADCADPSRRHLVLLPVSRLPGLAETVIAGREHRHPCRSGFGNGGHGWDQSSGKRPAYSRLGCSQDGGRPARFTVLLGPVHIHPVLIRAPGCLLATDGSVGCLPHSRLPAGRLCRQARRL